jgi:diadenosine tetraphosphate (Ap4A) HIT family hydrolase
MPLVAERVAQARAGKNPKVICRMPSGWAVIGDVQVLRGYCLLLADPVVSSINDLSSAARAQFLLDMVRIGDALLQLTDAYRINYEILGNSEPELHAHIIPRYRAEADDLRVQPAWVYDWPNAVPYSAEVHGELQQALRATLSRGATG